ncbi:MBL fold metallo-hydrolase [Anaeromyxobacter terrae]|uniref:MBL fold metallo-hydrolase n=1 Tax=Anaeromyxobacter terrae TaxID=2925406 RepID=UPI001F572BD0|nr:MBL fold metallo-hydrolase [Anaeromyxobacter sp. SG22]
MTAFGQPHDRDGRFVNLDGSHPAGLATVLRWAVWDRLTGRRRRAPDRAAVPTVVADVASLSRPPAEGEPARLTWLGHASFLVQVDGVSLLVDPVLQPAIFGGIARNVPPGVPLDGLPPIDAQLVTHNHYDHLDLPTLRAVGAPVVAGLGLARWFGARGLAATELGWWRSTQVGSVRVTFVPAHHWSRRGPLDTNATLWGGFVVEGSNATVYHSGDSAYFAGFREIGDRFPSIDAALLPIGAYEPGWFMLRQHMDPEQALRAFADLGARTFVPMHWGTFKLADEPLDEPPRRVEAERVRRDLSPERVRVLAVGETLRVARSLAVREPAAPR